MARSRSTGARTWASVLSDLAGVPVVVEWESPAWWVRWVDGPTQAQLKGRALALGEYRIGFPLRAVQLKFFRATSPVAAALGWLTLGTGTTDADLGSWVTTEGDVKSWLDAAPYPQIRAGTELLAAARVLAALSQGDRGRMAVLVSGAQPPLPPHTPTGPVITELPGRLTGMSWPGGGGPPAHLLQPSQPPPHVPAPEPAPSDPTPVAGGVCGRCQGPLPARSGNRGGRPAQYCSDRCRMAAHRQRTKPPATPVTT